LSEPAELLPWDSEHFGVRIARAAAGGLDPGKLDRWCGEHAVDCVYLLADAEDRDTLAGAAAAGFAVVDVRLTFDRPAPAAPAAAAEGVRPAHADDLPALRAIARRAYTDSRFYFDRRFPRQRCDALYERWIERSVDGGADAVLVGETDRRAAGYVTCLRGDAGTGSIGLVGVAEAARGRGLGGRLVAAALGWFAGQGVERVEVVTQGRNVAAQRLYQAHGFRTRRVEVSFHRWRPGAGEAEAG
jgi:dTDP-4-amino-4,6-dideoxy-D-galactose acyltransferase